MYWMSLWYLPGSTNRTFFYLCWCVLFRYLQSADPYMWAHFNDTGEQKRKKKKIHPRLSWNQYHNYILDPPGINLLSFRKAFHFPSSGLLEVILLLHGSVEFSPWGRRKSKLFLFTFFSPTALLSFKLNVHSCSKKTVHRQRADVKIFYNVNSLNISCFQCFLTLLDFIILFKKYYVFSSKNNANTICWTLVTG